MIDHSTCGGGLGSGGFGANPWGSGYELALLSAEQTALNAIDVTFLGVPESSNPFMASDALNVTNWTLVVVDPFGAQNRLVQYIARVSASVIRIYVDGPLQEDVLYKLVCSDALLSDSGIPIDPNCTEIDFMSFGLALVSQRANGQVVEPRMDLSNPFVPQDAKQSPIALGTFQLNDRRDYALESGASYLRKRILRRATTAIGGFFHLPSYGFAEPLKGPITPDTLRRMQTLAQAQVLREPDVVQATVTVSRDEATPSLVIVKIKALMRDNSTVQAEFPVDLAT